MRHPHPRPPERAAGRPGRSRGALGWRHGPALDTLRGATAVMGLLVVLTAGGSGSAPLAASAAGGAAADAAHAAAAAARGAPRVDAAVGAAVAREGRAAVIVALVPPRAAHAGSQADDIDRGVHADYPDYRDYPDYPKNADDTTDDTTDDASAARAVAAAQSAVLAGMPDGAFQVTHRYRLIPALAGRVTQTGLAALAARPEVAAVSLDPQVRPFLDESVPYIGADRVQRQGFSGAGQRVAVMDSGIDAGNLDLRDAVVEQACFLTPASLCPAEPNVARDVDGHGTMVSGVLASRGRRTAKGVAPAVEIVAVKLLEERNNAAGSAMLAAFDWAAARDDLDAINLSLGSGGYEGRCDGSDAFTRGLSAAVARMLRKGTVPVAASGNDGSPTKLSAPACLEGVVSVGAVRGYEAGGDPQLAPFTNRNDTLDFLAPGAGVATTGIGGRVVEMGGTSAAAPHVTGAVVLLRQAVPWAPPDVLVDALKRTGGRPTLRYGTLTISTIRVDQALRDLQRQTPPATEPAASPTHTRTPTTQAPATATATTAAATVTATASATTGATATADVTQLPTPTPDADATAPATTTATATATATSEATSPVPQPTVAPAYLPAARR